VTITSPYPITTEIILRYHLYIIVFFGVTPKIAKKSDPSDDSKNGIPTSVPFAVPSAYFQTLSSPGAGVKVGSEQLDLRSDDSTIRLGHPLLEIAWDRLLPEKQQKISKTQWFSWKFADFKNHLFVGIHRFWNKTPRVPSNLARPPVSLQPGIGFIVQVDPFGTTFLGATHWSYAAEGFFWGFTSHRHEWIQFIQYNYV
jgi:hypothetical protein